MNRNKVLTGKIVAEVTLYIYLKGGPSPYTVDLNRFCEEFGLSRNSIRTIFRYLQELNTIGQLDPGVYVHRTKIEPFDFYELSFIDRFERGKAGVKKKKEIQSRRQALHLDRLKRLIQIIQRIDMGIEIDEEEIDSIGAILGLLVEGGDLKKIIDHFSKKSIYGIQYIEKLYTSLPSSRSLDRALERDCEVIRSALFHINNIGL